MDNQGLDQITPNSIDFLPYQDITHLPVKKGIDPQVVCDLKDKGYTFVQIAKILKISKYTAFYHYHRLKPERETTKFFVDNRAEVFQEVQKRLLMSINEEDIKKTPVGSRVLAVAQLYDKERLETDQSTSNQAHIIGVAPELRQALNKASRSSKRVFEPPVCNKVGDKLPDNRDKAGILGDNPIVINDPKQVQTTDEYVTDIITDNNE